ncbi:YcxB family protein [Blastopirellula marina]|uniref:YcxB-like protein domain-containing protein n=1 Tax=Blastopirellula marina TaxID=124 RepID=A0A2S8GGJ1_9BACT|nr:YcxB family protein [Blastopirellula marina]PQO43569.1 hypothetical protein C5Y93_23250 [Blastopirellula marina]
MQVEFESHSHDAAAIQDAGSSSQTWRTNLLLILCGILIGLPGVVPALILGYHWIALLIGIVFYSVLFQYAKRLLRPSEEVPVPASGVIRFRLQPNYLEHEFLWNRGRTAWSHIQEAVVHDDFLHIRVDPATSFIIPRRAFGTIDEMQAFAATAQAHIAAARETTPPAIGLYDDDFFAAWTKEAGLTVEYQNTRADWAYALEKGGAGAHWQSWQNRVARNAFYLVLCAAMIFMASKVQHVGLAAAVLVASAAFWYVGSITLLLLARERRRQSGVPEQWLTNRTLFISPVGVISLTSFAIYCSDWHYYEEVADDNGFVYFIADKVVSVLAPKRAFPSIGQAEHFAQEAAQWHAKALMPLEEPPEAASAAVSPSDDKNPDQSPQT